MEAYPGYSWGSGISAFQNFSRTEKQNANIGMGHLEERWNQLKRRDVLSDVLEEVSEIVEVVSKYGKNPEDDKLVRSMNEVIAKLIVDPKNGNHEKIVQVFRKYLN